MVIMLSEIKGDNWDHQKTCIFFNLYTKLYYNLTTKNHGVFWFSASFTHMLTELRGSLLVDHLTLRREIETVDMPLCSLSVSLIF